MAAGLVPSDAYAIWRADSTRPKTIVFAGAGEIRQVISNMLLNSGDAVSGAGGRICVRLHRHAGDMIRLMIAGSGPGIPTGYRSN